MTGPQADGSGRWKRFLGAGLLVFWAVLLLVLIPWLIRRFGESAAKSDIERELAAIRAKGEPVTIEELAPPPVPDEENAAVPLKKALAAIKQAHAEAKALPWVALWWDQFPENPGAKRTAEVLKLYEEPVTLAVAALERPQCRFDIDYSQPFVEALLSARPEEIYLLSMLFLARALESAHRGQGGGVVEALRAHQALASAQSTTNLSSMDGHPAVYHLSWLLPVIQRIERSTPLPDEHVLATRDMLLRHDLRRYLRDMLVGERVKCIEVFKLRRPEQIVELARDDSSVREEHGSYALVEMQRKAADWLATVASAIEMTDCRAREVIQQVARSNEPLRDLVVMVTPKSFSHLDYSFQFTPGSFLDTWARRDAAVIGLSCELYRSKHGRYPDKPDALVPEFLDKLPPDPFTGKPFVYRRRGEGDAAGFIVYSVGENLKDDGGVSDSSARSKDIAWESGATPKP